MIRAGYSYVSWVSFISQTGMDRLDVSSRVHVHRSNSSRSTTTRASTVERTIEVCPWHGLPYSTLSTHDQHCCRRPDAVRLCVLDLVWTYVYMHGCMQVLASNYTQSNTNRLVLLLIIVLRRTNNCTQAEATGIMSATMSGSEQH